MDKEIVIINKNVNEADKAIEFFSNKNEILFTNQNDNKFLQVLKDKIAKGYNLFIICGGDGTVNNFINSYMKLDAKSRRNIKISIIPCGRANDLARKLQIPFQLDKAHDTIKKNKTKLIDIIQVNDKFFITGGGFGLPAEVIQDVNKHSKKISKKLLRDLIYYFSVFKKVFISYSGTKIKNIDNNLMFFAVCNQDFMGKRFFLSPSSINDDGYFEICYVPKPKNAISSFLVTKKVIRGEHITLKDCVTFKTNYIKINLNNKNWFMADGELLELNDKFEFKIVPKAISIFC